MSDIVERLKERRKLRFMADCKCGHCQLVHIDTVYEASDVIERLRSVQAILVEALEDALSYVDPEGPYSAMAYMRGRTALKLAKEEKP